jgi:hypothetical protein
MDALASGQPAKAWHQLQESVELPTQHAGGSAN